MNAVVALLREVGEAATTALAAVGAVTVAAVLSGALVVSVDVQASTAPTEASTVPVAVCGSDADCAAYDRARGVAPTGYGTAGK